MGHDDTLTLESNGLLDFFPAEPGNTKEIVNDADEESGRNGGPTYDQRLKNGHTGGDSPPPDFDEEPSDFEDEVEGIMQREKESTVPMQSPGRMDEDLDIDQEAPVASCKHPHYLTRELLTLDPASRSRPSRHNHLAQPPDDMKGMDVDSNTNGGDGPQLELLPIFASSLQTIAPLRVETASGKTVIFKRRAKPVPKPIPVSPHFILLLRWLICLAGRERSGKYGRIQPTFCTYTQITSRGRGA
jgi:hypothetical protein